MAGRAPQPARAAACRGPAHRYDAEFAFWRAATGWADEPVDAPEFQRLVHRAESSLQQLVQRPGRDDGTTQARAHLDPGTDAVAAEIDRDEAAQRPRAGAPTRATDRARTAVLELIPQGLSIRRIGAALYISESRVVLHVHT